MYVFHPFLYVVAVFVICVYAWKDWFKGLCGLIILTAFVVNPTFPTNIAGIQGLNLWNVAFAGVALGWLRGRRLEGLSWDMPTKINVFLLLWLGVIFLGWARMVLDRGQLAGASVLGLFSDYLVNTVKWPILGLWVFDGCRSRQRVKVALVCILIMFAQFAIHMARTMPPSMVTTGGLEDMKARSELKEKVGISPNGAAKMLSGVPWAALAAASILNRRKYKFLLYGVSLVSLYALALTGGRAGYLASGATLVFLGFIRWRRHLLLAPLLLLLLPVALPGAADRMFEGFGQTTVTGEQQDNIHDISAGRSEIWAFVIPKIFESPVVGFGRRAMPRTGMTQELLNIWGAAASMAVSHPHNAYLEVLLENGLNGFVVVVGLHMLILVYAVRTFVAREDPMLMAAGGVALSLLTGHLVANLGGQSFYPRPTDVGLWCAIGAMLRCYVNMQSLGSQGEQNISSWRMSTQGQQSLTNTAAY